MATALPASWAAVLMLLMFCAWTSCVPWDMLTRATSMPASIKRASMSGDCVAGPMVQTIFVRCMDVTPLR